MAAGRRFKQEWGARLGLPAGENRSLDSPACTRGRTTLIRVIVIAAAIWQGGPALADPPDAQAQSIRAVIGRQIEAFRRDDAQEAFALASPGIRARFGDARRFLAMVREAYPAVYRPSFVQFGSLSAQADGQATQTVALVGPDGHDATARYLLSRQTDGTWLIDGCTVTTQDTVHG